MVNNNSTWQQEGMIPGQPAHDTEWERQRQKLLNFIHRLIDLGCSLTEVKDAALTWNGNQAEPFTDTDVSGVCRWAWDKWGHEEPTTST